MTPRYLTVSALNRYIKVKFDEDFALKSLYIQAELSNVKYHQSGHCYFTLKDEKSRINAVMFSSALRHVPFTLEDGLKVLILGKAGVYEPSGSYQIYVSDIQIDGIGNLYLQYEQIRKRLETQGLFSPQRKKQLPKYPMKIGVITASTGAAIHDIKKTIRSINHTSSIYFFPSLVQGKEAAGSLIEALQLSYQYPLDVLIIGRGGGSLEDLWAFNDEALAYTIASAPFPIISGVGHESDVVISDFVADARAATPTAAARLACFDEEQLKEQLLKQEQKLIQAMQLKIERKASDLRLLIQSSPLHRPQYYYANEMISLDLLTARFNKAMTSIIQNQKYLINHRKQALEGQLSAYLQKKEASTIKADQLNKLMALKLNQNKQYLGYTIASLNAYNPLNVLERGYSLVKQDDKIVKSIEDFKDNESFELQFKDGSVLIRR